MKKKQKKNKINRTNKMKLITIKIANKNLVTIKLSKNKIKIKN